MDAKKEFDTKFLRKKIIIYILSVLGAFFVISFVFFLYMELYNEKKREELYHNKITKNIDYSIAHYLKNYSNLLERFIVYGDIENKIIQNDKEGLYKNLKPRWDLLVKQGKKIEDLQVYLKSGTPFLRICNIKNCDDYFSQKNPMLEQIKQTNKPVMGYDIGKKFAKYRILYPLFDKDNSFIGSIELGLNSNFILENLYEMESSRGLIFVQDDGEIDKKNKFVIDDYVLESKIPSELKGIEKVLKSLKLVGKNKKIFINGKFYLLHMIELNDYKNKSKAKILFFQKVSDGKTSNFLVFIIFFVMFIILLVAFYFISKLIYGYETRIVKIHKRHIKDIKEKEDAMIAQSRQAAMGEMISMIAHQWRQPINIIALQATNVIFDIEFDKLDKQRLHNTAKSIVHQTQELSETIDDFRNFLKPDKKVVTTTLSQVLDEAFSIVEVSIKKDNIKVYKNLQSIEELQTYSRELMQVFINILNNAKEAIAENTLDEGRIFISSSDEQNGNAIVKICNNGGNINEEIIQNIFEPYFSTKDEKMGTGLGLYMSKTIIEKHLKGSLEVYNKDQGVCFKIVLPRHIKDIKN